jgi:hypothetical protein
MRYRLTADVATLEIGWFLLGTMRKERDFQGTGWHRRPYEDPPFILPELTGLIEALERLPGEHHESHLAALNAVDTEELRSRLEPGVTLTEDADTWVVLVEHTSLDGRNHMRLELRGETDAASATLLDDRISVEARSGDRIELDVGVTTDSEALTPLGRERLFNDTFEAYYQTQRGVADSLRAVLGVDEAARDPRVLAFRRVERQVRGLELLGSEEKLMASMPNYATYFGRDQMMSALMLEPISSVDLQELVIASVLRKVEPGGNVSHEEALGGQAIRENAAEYAALIEAFAQGEEADPEAAAEHLTRAFELLTDLQKVRENYRMVDDDFQLPILVGRYLSRPDVPAARKQRFLTAANGEGSAGDVGSRLEALMSNLAFVASLASPFADDPVPGNLVSFFHQDDEGWLPGSWRDSRAGYGNGRFAMDVNVVWVPRALEALEEILEALEALDLSADEHLSGVALEASALEGFLRDRVALRTAIVTWSEARGYFEVRLDPSETGLSVNGLLAELSDPEAQYWRERLDQADDGALRPLSFLALSLEGEGRPVAAANSDPATELFLGDYTEWILEGRVEPAEVLTMIDPFLQPYPVGLFVEGLGPLVVNDAYAEPEVREWFREDLYHSPQVVWGREVNLLLLGLARQIEAAYDSSGQLRDPGEPMRSYVESLRRALEANAAAVEASGLSHNELWSYRIEDGALRPIRYGTSSDIQLWNVTDLAVGFLLDRLPNP